MREHGHVFTALWMGRLDGLRAVPDGDGRATVLVADDVASVRSVIVELLSTDERIEVVAEAEDAATAVAAARAGTNPT